MLRHCDGTDDNLIREISEFEFAAPMMLSSWHRPESHDPATVIIRCDCGLAFDDCEREVIWPHPALPPKMTEEELDRLWAMLGNGA